MPPNKTHLSATPQLALETAAVEREVGITLYILGEARDIAKVLSAITPRVTRHGQQFQALCALLSGGETTVTVRGTGH